MSRRRLPLLLVSVVVVLAGLATMATGNAGAAEPPPWPGTSICATGTLAFSNWVDPNTMRFTGSTQPCPGTDPATVPGARWAVAEYHARGAFVYEYDIKQFDSATAPTAVQAQVQVNGLQNAVWGQLRAVCLITAASARLACMEVTTEWNGGLRIEPIPVTDTRVQTPVTVVPNETTKPECGACV
jgi:hypothetical protein